MSIGITIVKTTVVETNKDILFAFSDTDIAGKKVFELESNPGFTGTVLYPCVEGYDEKVSFAEELYDDYESRYLDRFSL